jgi:DNA replication protein DnaC
MAEPPDAQTPPPQRGTSEPHLAELTLGCSAAPSAAVATQAAHTAWAPVDDLATRLAGEAHVRRERATNSRMRLARCPVLTTLEQFRWDWPTRLPRLQGQHHGRVALSKDKAQGSLLGAVGWGTTPLATARGTAACLQGAAGLLASALDGINTRAAAQSAGRLKAERKQYTTPALRIRDELG